MFGFSCPIVKNVCSPPRCHPCCAYACNTASLSLGQHKMNQTQKTFKDCFLCLMDSRLNHIFSDVINKDPIYKDNMEQAIELHDSIFQLLGQEHKELITEYEKISDYFTETHQDTAYIIGFKDGMQLQRLLGELS